MNASKVAKERLQHHGEVQTGNSKKKKILLAILLPIGLLGMCGAGVGVGYALWYSKNGHSPIIETSKSTIVQNQVVDVDVGASKTIQLTATDEDGNILSDVQWSAPYQFIDNTIKYWTCPIPLSDDNGTTSKRSYARLYPDGKFELDLSAHDPSVALSSIFTFNLSCKKDGYISTEQTICLNIYGKAAVTANPDYYYIARGELVWATSTPLPDMTKITLPSTVSSVRGKAFADAGRWVKEIAFESGSYLRDLQPLSFWHVYSLQKLTLPSTLIKLPTSAFADCPNLTNITLEGDMDITKFDSSGKIFSNLPLVGNIYSHSSAYASNHDGLLEKYIDMGLPSGWTLIWNG